MIISIIALLIGITNLYFIFKHKKYNQVHIDKINRNFPKIEDNLKIIKAEYKNRDIEINQNTKITEQNKKLIESKISHFEKYLKEYELRHNSFISELSKERLLTETLRSPLNKKYYFPSVDKTKTNV